MVSLKDLFFESRERPVKWKIDDYRWK